MVPVSSSDDVGCRLPLTFLGALVATLFAGCASAAGPGGPPSNTQPARASSLLSRAPSPVPTHGGAFFVATSGSDTTGTGAAGNPWRTITHAINSAGGPGVAIEVRAGTYNERVSIDRSGSATAGFTISNYDYPKVAVIDGSKIPYANDGSYAYGLVSLQNQSYVTFRGFEVMGFKTANDSETLAGIEVEGSGTDIALVNNHITEIWNTGVASSHNGDCGGSEPQAFGLIVAGTNGTKPISRVTIRGNELNDLRTGCSESMTVNGNVVDFVIASNTVHDNSNIGIDAIGGEGVASGYNQYNGSENDQARDGEIDDNVVYNIHSSSLGASGVYGTACNCADGLYLDGSEAIVVERNTVHNTDLGIEVTGEGAAQNTSDDIVRDNLFYANLETGIGIGGNGTPGGASNVRVLDNTLYDNSTDANNGTGDVYVGTKLSAPIVFENNVVDAGPLGPIGGQTQTKGLTFDDNLYFNGTSPFAEPHSLNTDPKFVDPNSSPPNLQVQSGSPALKRGTTSLGSLVGPYDVSGAPRIDANDGTIDIGAYEQQ
jgi:Right handed beta helix region